MSALEMIDALSNFEIRHRHYPSHQALSIGVKPFAAFDGFYKKIEKMCFRCCTRHGFN